MDHDTEDLLTHNKRLQETNTYLQNVLTHLTKQLKQCRQCRSVALRHYTSCVLPLRSDRNDGNSNEGSDRNDSNDSNDSNEGNDSNNILSPKFHGNNTEDIDYDDIPSPNLRSDDVLSPALRSDNDDSDISNSNNIPSRVVHGSNSSNKNIVSTYPELIILPYNPESDSRRSRNPSQSVSKPEWQKSADKLVGNNLSTVQSMIEPYDKQQWDDRIGSILGQFDSFIEPGSLPPSAHTPLMRVRKFACANISSKRIASFRDLLVVSACQVLRHCGHDRDEIDKILQLCVSDSSSAYLARILRGSQWVGEQICALRETWGHLATECIYHSKLKRKIGFIKELYSLCLRWDVSTGLECFRREYKNFNAVYPCLTASDERNWKRNAKTNAIITIRIYSAVYATSCTKVDWNRVFVSNAALSSLSRN